MTSKQIKEILNLLEEKIWDKNTDPSNKRYMEVTF